MDCKTTSTRKQRLAFTLVELLVAIGIGGIAMTSVLSMVSYSGRSLAALFNYTDLDFYSRRALDQMSREIRQADNCTIGTSNHVVLTYRDPAGAAHSLEYTYSPTARTLTRTRDGRSDVLLKECDYLRFGVYQRTPVGGVYEQFPVNVTNTTKLIQVTWVCTREIMRARVNSESVHSAKFVLRN
jgi:prepilin-type N-terminal cleavage/methylation domain-containing protein